MATFYLVLTWAILGLLTGLCALAAGLKPGAWGQNSGKWLLALSLGASLAGGLLGFWLTGRLFSSACALWLAVLAACAPAMYERARGWLTGRVRQYCGPTVKKPASD